MAYLVSITPRAERDFADLYDAVNAGASVAALKWYRGLKAALLTLSEHPARCPATPEKKELRHLLYGSKPHIYRVIFRVQEKHKKVEILHIRHGAQRALQSSDIR